VVSRRRFLRVAGPGVSDLVGVKRDRGRVRKSHKRQADSQHTGQLKPVHSIHGSAATAVVGPADIAVAERVSPNVAVTSVI